MQRAMFFLPVVEGQIKLTVKPNINGGGIPPFFLV